MAERRHVLLLVRLVADDQRAAGNRRTGGAGGAAALGTAQPRQHKGRGFPGFVVVGNAAALPLSNFPFSWVA